MAEQEHEVISLASIQSHSPYGDYAFILDGVVVYVGRYRTGKDAQEARDNIYPRAVVVLALGDEGPHHLEHLRPRGWKGVQ